MLVSMIGAAAATAAQPSPFTIPTHPVRIEVAGPPVPPPRLDTAPPPSSAAALPPPGPLPTPSAAARRLAMRMVEGIKILRFVAQTDVEIALTGWSADDPGCDRSNPECRRIAREMAEREALSRVAEMTDQLSRILGDHFDRTMSAAQIADALGFAESPSGRAMLQSLFDLDQIDHRQLQNLRLSGRDSPAVQADHIAALRREFRERTRNLPRQAEPRVPMVLMPPPAPPASPAHPTPPHR